MNHADEELDGYRYKGARALVLLHEEELRRFVATWRMAREAGLTLAGFQDPNYESLEKLLAHVLWWARDYMVWVCDKLRLLDPEIIDVPEPEALVAELDPYLEHLLGRWSVRLSVIQEEPFFEPQHTTRWGSDLPVEALLEHAVVHPMRHRLQLREMLGHANRRE